MTEDDQVGGDVLVEAKHGRSQKGTNGASTRSLQDLARRLGESADRAAGKKNGADERAKLQASIERVAATSTYVSPRDQDVEDLARPNAAARAANDGKSQRYKPKRC